MTEELKPFTCTYRFEGRSVDFTVQARSWEDASKRLRAIGMTATVEGEQVSEIDAGIFGEGLGRAMTAVRSIFKGDGK